MDIAATVGRRGLHPDVERASEQSAVCNQRRRRSADRVRAALTGGRGGGRCRHLGRGVRRVWSALDPLFPSRDHRGIVAAALGLALALLALAEQKGIVSPFVVDAIFATARWIFLAAMVFTTVYVFWSGFAERVLTIRYASGAVAISMAFGAAWLTVLHIAGVQLAGMSAMNAVWILLPALLPLTIGMLAPWSYRPHAAHMKGPQA